MRRLQVNGTWAPTLAPTFTVGLQLDYVVPLIAAGAIKTNEFLLLDQLQIYAQLGSSFSHTTSGVTQGFLSTPIEWATKRAHLSGTPDIAVQKLSFYANSAGAANAFAIKLSDLNGGLNYYLRYWAAVTAAQPTTWRGKLEFMVAGRVYFNTEVPPSSSTYRESPAQKIPDSLTPPLIPLV